MKTLLDFFIDNGSTCSLLSSRKYKELKSGLDPLVRPMDTSVYGACGDVIPSHGAVDVKISLGGCDFEQTLIICDIQQDAVIGQDFLLNYAESINYKQGRINMKFNEINCWLGERCTAKCRVMIRNTTAVSLQIASWLPTQVPGSKNVTKFGYVQANSANNTNSVVNSSILDSQKAKKCVSVVNNAENPITPLSKQAICPCEVYPDKNDDTGFYQSGMYSTIQDTLYRVETTDIETRGPVPDFSTERSSSPLFYAPYQMYTVPTTDLYQGERSIDSQMYSTDGVYDSCLHVQQDAPHDISRSQSQSKCPPAVHQHNDPVVVRALAGPVNEARIFDLKPDKRSREPRPIVSLYDPTSPISVCPRFPRKWNGPIRQKLQEVMYRVKTPRMRTTKAYINDSGCPYSSRNSATLFHRAKIKGRSQ